MTCGKRYACHPLTFCPLCLTFLIRQSYDNRIGKELHFMREALYEPFLTTSPLGISFAWHTNSGGHHPLHWHEDVEIMYPLSGKADIVIDGIYHNLLKRHLLVVESRQVHSSHSEESGSMFLCIHLSKTRLKEYLPSIETTRIQCFPEEIPDNLFEPYLEICQMLDQLTRLYVKELPTFHMEADGIILQVIAKLLEHFSVQSSAAFSAADTLSIERIQKIIAFVEDNFQEPLSDAAGLLGIGKEYFCRFFKKNMGMSFLEYVTEVRLSHVYYDLVHTDLSVLEIMEKNGFTNQKLFNQAFKKLYDCTPSGVRKRLKEGDGSAGDLNLI